jgi:hypothetical protein
MVLAEDVKSAHDLLLIARGQEVTPSLLERLRNLPADAGTSKPILMVIRDEKRTPELVASG